MNKLYQLIYYGLVLILALLPAFVEAQDLTISGKVTDGDTGTGLPGVNVIVKGSSMGTATDVDGKFSLTVSRGATLIVSYIGFATQEVAVSNESFFDIRLQSDITQLNEIVVVGYGTQQKREIVGSIAKVNGSDLTIAPTPSFESALQGRAAGVQVIQGSGLAGSGAVVRVRGIASVSAGGDPLYVVDGIPITQTQFLNGNSGAMNTNPLAAINPNDIESIEILKDASAAGIYGSRGANGVVIVTTKRGKSGKPSFSFSSRFGFSEPTAKAKMLNSEEYLQLYQEAYENDGGVGQAPLPGGILWTDAVNTDTDWWDLTTQTGIKQDYSISMSQGNRKFATYANLSYGNNESYLVGNAYKRLSGRVNFDYTFNEKLKASLSTSLSQGDNVRVNAAWSGGLGAAMSTALPIYPVYNADGTFRVIPGAPNPVRQTALTDWHTIDTRSITNLNFIVKPIERLTLNIGGSYDFLKNNDDKWEAAALVGQPDSVLGQAFANLRYVDNYNVTATAEYGFNVPVDHSLKLLLGTEYQQSITESSNNGIIGVSEPLYQDPTPLDSAEYFGSDERFRGEEVKFFSVFSRVNYTYKDRYIFQATLRTDGSSKFGPENQYGFFPTIALGWIASEEEFMKSFETISLLKFKISYGILGNSNFAQNEYIGTYRLAGPTIDGTPGYNSSNILYPTKRANPDLKWETSGNFDLGFELGLFNNRLTSEFAYYFRRNKDVLMQLTLPSQNGLDGQYFENVGEVVNAGLELSFTSRNLVGKFKWTTNFNIARNRNEVRSIGNFSDEAVSGGTNDTRIIIGQPIGTNYLVRYSHVDAETGKPVYLTKEGEETFTWDPIDRVAVGNVLPDFTGGITNTFEYKGFAFSFLFIFTKGGDIYDSSSKRQLGVVTDWNMRQDLFDRWRQPGDVTKYPRLTLDTQTYGSGTPWINTDLWIHDGSYIRLRTVSLEYRLPTEWVSKLRLKNASVGVAGSNLLTFTNYEGLDPEIARDFENATDRNMSPNITYLTPPQEKSITFSLNLGF